MPRLILRMLSCLLVLLSSILLMPPGFSQTVTTGEVTGTVLDPAGAHVPEATVTLKSADTGESRSVPSNDSGVYRFTFVKPGKYEISALSAGLKSDVGSLAAGVGQVQDLDVHLKIEEPKEVILVTDEAPLLNTDNANIVYTLSSRQLDLLPLPGGDLVSVAYSMPGVVINYRSGSGFGTFVSQGVGGLSNLFTMNGIDDMDPYLNVNNHGPTGLLLGANEVQEASIVQNPYEGQYGRQAGAQVNYVTKSGTNTYHGNLLYNYNGTQMNANDFFSNASGTPRPHAVSNQYAAAIGGPVLKDKLFFFADTEGLRYALPGSASVITIPSPAAQSYSLRTIQPSQVPFYRKMFDLYNSAPGAERAVPVTTGKGLLQDSSGNLGCGALAGTPAGTGGVFGTDVSCAEAWTTNVPNQTSEWLLSTRLDYNLSSNQRLFFRFKTDHGYSADVRNFMNPLFTAFRTQPDYEGQANYSLAITPRLLNNFIGAATYNDYVSSVADLNAALAIFPVQLVIRPGLANGGIPINSSIGPPATYPTGRRETQIQMIDDVSYLAGRHSVKAGVNYRYIRETDLGSGFINRGQFSLSLNALVSGALSPSSSYTQSFTASPILHLRLHSVGFYVQDQWSITPRLKVTATLRFDRNGNPDCVDSCFARLVSPFPSIEKGSSIPYDQSIQSGLSRAFYNIETIVPQPRVGVAYNPAWSRHTVLRGGIGLFADLYPVSFLELMAANPPNLFASTIATGLIDMAGTASAPAIAAASANAFQSQFASGATLSQLQQAVAPASFAAPNYYSIPSTLRNPKYLEWSLEIQHQFDVKSVLDIRYAGNHGYDVFVVNPYINASANPGVFPGGLAGLPTAAPDPRFAAVFQYSNSGYSNYDGLAVEFRRGFAHGFLGQISYTWSHALDTLSNGGLLPFAFDPFTGGSVRGQINPGDLRSLNYSNADYDVRHNLTGDFIWEGPIKLKRKWMTHLLGGWAVGTRANAHSGTPFSVTNFAITRSLPAGFAGAVLADVTDPTTSRSCGRTAIDTPCFAGGQFVAAPKQTDFGNLPRNSFRGPGFFNIDSTLYKIVPVGERMRFTFGASAYNLLNHPNFADPNADVFFPGLGLITSTVGGPSSPYGAYGPTTSARTIVVTGKFAF